MNIEQYKIGQKITVVRKSDTKGVEYNSTIQNIKNDFLYISVPYNEERPLILIRNEKVLIKYVAKSAAYRFTSSYAGTYKESESLRLYKFTAPREEDIERIQMRGFVRVPVSMEVQYLLPDSEEPRKGLSVDLSAGGMKLATKSRLEVNTELDLYFQLPSKKQVLHMPVRAKVLRCELVNDETKVYHAGLKFLNVHRKMEDTICSFVFEKQMEQRRRR
ncbi:c-di-GMP-binding flagellar brake protein YcgR [Desulfohalotomaculum tongense]|uniref:flagellar brake protein n=1 Tax=Desulforadius tongensis TaxID=1216062 RepID=UPI001958CFE5|nr:flagellar brake domain-containing protein [Desulforadius tongensis]MBM7854228.1 c-di-GMP-binding flagellar brake protein YcgR [Desulforadius tongensis]